MENNQDLINYDILIQRAMREVIKYALKGLQKQNIDKKFCFVFHINTKHKGVVLPLYIKQQYPEEITLILQHQFDSLVVKNNSFSVNLSFSGKIENVVIPFSSILIFSDQEAGIELRFDNYREYSLIEDYEEFDEDESDNINVINDIKVRDDDSNLIDFKNLKNR